MKNKKINKNNSQNTVSTWSAIKWLFSYLKNKRWLIIALLLLIVISSVGQLCSIYYTGYVYDRYLIPKDWNQQVFTSFCVIIAYLVIFQLFDRLFSYFADMITAKICESTICYSMRNNFLKKIQSLPIRFFDTNPAGRLISRVGLDINSINMAINEYTTMNIYWTFNMIGIIVMIFLINTPLAGITLIIDPIMLIVMAILTKKMYPYNILQLEKTSQMISFIEERVSGSKAILLYQQEKLNESEFKKINQEVTTASINAGVRSNALQPITSFFNNIAFVVLAGLGISLVALGKIKTDAGILPFENPASLLITYTIFARHFTIPFVQIISSFPQIFLGIASLKRIYQIMKEPAEIDNPDAKEIDWEVKGEIEVKNLNFKYNVNTDLVLKNINFKAHPNKITAIVGKTGVGKTTFANLLARFYDYSSGEILIDGVPIHKIKKESLRENITMVLQDAFLFNGTIRENIRYGRLNATDQEIELAAKLSNADKFINLLPDKYDTIIEHNGENLSQGQKQLLCLARAFISNKQILFLDEATSSVDTTTEKDIQEALTLLMHNKTAFVIAHRLSTIKNAHNILVIKNGEIVEHGNHKQLIAKKGYYEELYNSQFRKN